MTFPSDNSDLRNDKSFRNTEQPNHYKGDSLLAKLIIDMGEQFPIDYLLCVCFGEVKRLLKLNIQHQTTYILSPNELIMLSNMLVLLKQCLPQEFTRMPRSIFDIKYWKGTESRQFLLFSGIMLLKLFIPNKAYVHFFFIEYHNQNFV